MAIIFEKQTVSGFTEDADLGGYVSEYVTPAQFTLVEGETYYVEWDGETYECKGIACQYKPSNITTMSIVYLGNGSSLGYEGNNEPFAITYNVTGNGTQFFATEADASHTVAISTVEEGILFYDNNGELVEFYDVETLTVDTSKGTQQVFTKGEAVEGVEIELALADGDQTVNAPEGYLVKNAVIKKPDTLIPENIVKDFVIAGVTGTHKCSGGGDWEEKPVVLKSQRVVSCVLKTTSYSVTVRVPTMANILEASAVGGSTSGNVPSLDYSRWPVCDISTLTKSYTYERDRWNYTYTRSFSTSYYPILGLSIRFTLPNTVYKKQGEDIILYVGDAIVDFDYDICLDDSAPFTKLDLSNTTGTILATYVANGYQNLTEILLPATLTYVRSGAISRCPNLSRVDFSRCTQVPTLTGTVNFTQCAENLEILVPAALYDEWIAASVWSTHASKIVAV